MPRNCPGFSSGVGPCKVVTGTALPLGTGLRHQEAMLWVECGQMGTHSGSHRVPSLASLHIPACMVTEGIALHAWPVQNTSEQEKEGPAWTSGCVSGVEAKVFMLCIGVGSEEKRGVSSYQTVKASQAGPVAPRVLLYLSTWHLPCMGRCSKAVRSLKL